MDGRAVFFKMIRMPEKVFMFGLDGAGKSVIANYLAHKTIDTNTAPTVSFKQQTFVLQKMEVVLWDTPGQVKYREKWLKNAAESKVLVFVLDTGDPARFPEVKREFEGFIKGCYNLRAPVIFCFHQMDKPEAQASLNKAEELFELDKAHLLSIVSITTTIKDTETLDTLRDKIQELLEARQAEDGQVETGRKQIEKELKKKARR
jgi:small GTP-binding protein